MRVLAAVFFAIAVTPASAGGDRPLAASNGFLPSVAVYTSVLRDTFHCMSGAGIKVVFVRVYEPRTAASSKTGAQQFREAFDYMQTQAPFLTMYRAWLMVQQEASVPVGIYTNWYDWEQITGSTTAVSSNVLVRVLPDSVDSASRNTNGFGDMSESSPDFDDFFPFGKFRSAAAKTYGIGESLCSTPVHRNIYWRSWLDGEES
ncbi:hypothetical protein M3Y99_01057000 [Aphelenchoides fujianensis]|nr:hypothetical protein M3Y99_01057000 [Aphelenchoides fujianensis]